MDTLNALFEVSAGFFILFSILRLHREKSAAGVSVVTIVFFSVWGYWNLLYYPSVGHWWSFTGAAGVALANTVYALMILRQRRRDRA